MKNLVAVVPSRAAPAQRIINASQTSKFEQIELEAEVAGSDDEGKMAPRETFISQAYHSNAAVVKDGDNIEPEPITEFTQEVASELLSAHD